MPVLIARNHKIGFAVAVEIARHNRVGEQSPIDVFNRAVARTRDDELPDVAAFVEKNAEIVFAVAVVIAGRSRYIVGCAIAERNG